MFVECQTKQSPDKHHLAGHALDFQNDDQLLQQTNFNRTYLTRNDRDLCVDTILRKFWETENVALVELGPLKAEDHEALEKVKQSLTYENGMYQVAIP